MTETHREKLVYTESEDGYLLEGAVFTPADGGRGKLPVVWMHGFTGRFYEQHTVAIGRRLAARGHVFVTGNSRGHHLGANVVNLRGGEHMHGGAWWEQFDEAPLDYAGWIGFTAGLGFAKVVLVGHSLGAMKAVYYMGTRGDDRVAGLVSASGPLRIHERMRESPERLRLAEGMVAEGRGRELLPNDGVSLPGSAQTLAARARVGMDVYGLDAADAPVSKVRCPILFVLGSEEPGIAVEGDLPTLRANAGAASRVDTLYLPGANHVYTGHERGVADGIADWVERLG
jgi:pimeloyl-ACP methyl ester carboxylesterase